MEAKVTVWPLMENLVPDTHVADVKVRGLAVSWMIKFDPGQAKFTTSPEEKEMVPLVSSGRKNASWSDPLGLSTRGCGLLKSSFTDIEQAGEKEC